MTALPVGTLTSVARCVLARFIDAIDGASGALRATVTATTATATAATSATPAEATCREHIGATSPSLPPNVLGGITLYPHQQDAAVALARRLRAYGGALLADEPGMGKTFTALRVAQTYRRILVVAPAALASLWRDAAERAQLTIQFRSYEAMSRHGAATDSRFDLLVLDEAHHLRNPVTRRYRVVSQLAWGSEVLLLSATPVQNRRRDLVSLLALFLGSGAGGLGDHELARLVVRRRVGDVDQHIRIPALRTLRWENVSPCREVLDAILALPPPLPPLGGGRADALVRLALVRAWCSSDAALVDAIRRRLAQASALEHALAHGRYPTRMELRAWVVDGSAIQLAFPELLASTVAPSTRPLLTAIARHVDALRVLCHMASTDFSRDATRFGRLRDVISAVPGTPALVFTHAQATARAAFRALSPTFRCALLTGDAGHIASGVLPRAEILSHFGTSTESRATARSHRELRHLDRSVRGLPRHDADTPAHDQISTAGNAVSRTPSDIHSAHPSRGKPNGGDDRVLQIDVLVATDVVSEGVNLQAAGLVVHLDLPWTVARLEQRVGRARRLGSNHEEVVQVAIAPPVDAAELRGVVRHLAEKGGIARRLIGDSLPPGARLIAPVQAGDEETSPSDALQALRRHLRSRAESARVDPPPSSRNGGREHATRSALTVVLSTNAAAWGALALVLRGDEYEIVTLDDVTDNTSSPSTDPRHAVRMLERTLVEVATPSRFDRAIPNETGAADATNDSRASRDEGRTGRSMLAEMTERATHRVNEWCRSRDAQDATIASVHARSFVHRQLLRRLSALPHRSRLERLAVSTLVARVRSLVLATSGIGGECVLRELESSAAQGTTAPDALRRWLERSAQALDGRARPSAEWVERRIDAMLCVMPTH